MPIAVCLIGWLCAGIAGVAGDAEPHHIHSRQVRADSAAAAALVVVVRHLGLV